MWLEAKAEKGSGSKAVRQAGSADCARVRGLCCVVSGAQIGYCSVSPSVGVLVTRDSGGKNRKVNGRGGSALVRRAERGEDPSG